MGEMDAYKDVFLSESAEFIQSITDGLIALEQKPDDLAPVETIFRGAHSLKGMAATMGYDRTAELTHKMESLMDLVRRRERVADEELVDLMLEAVDTVRDLIDEESSSGNEIDPAELIDRIVAFTEAAPLSDLDEVESSAGEDEPGPERQAAATAGLGEIYSVLTTLEEACVLKSVRAYMVIKRLSHMGEVLDTDPTGQEIEDEQFDREFTVILQTTGTPDEIEQAVLGVSEIEGVAIEEREEHLAEPVEMIGSASAEAARRTHMPKLSQTQTVRVAIGHLDNMVDLVGELVTIKARLGDMASRSDDPLLSHTVEEYQRVVGDLQHEVMLTRMVPVDHIFNRFPRMVRDLARDLGKDLEFQMRGADIELDRTVLDEIGDPIVHLLRNSVDHGIEPADERVAAGKPARGTVRLVAERVRDHVRIAVTDDGRGIDCESVWLKAVDRGIADEEDRDTYSEDQILQFTCVPGFSTTSEATKVSGRGVGMDVVKGKIEYLGGTLEINSEPGVGSEFVLSLPLTLAIIQALLVRSAEQTYALPLAAIDEILSSMDVQVDTVDGAPVVVHRDGEVIPLYPLDALLDEDSDPLRLPSETEHIVLVDAGGRRRALHTSKLLGRREIVIKPLARMFRGVRGLGGATVLGDGSVAIILDPRTVFPSREETT
jgi:two-component system chemotaxis sensor kinase CheA